MASAKRRTHSRLLDHPQRSRTAEGSKVAETLPIHEAKRALEAGCLRRLQRRLQWMMTSRAWKHRIHGKLGGLCLGKPNMSSLSCLSSTSPGASVMRSVARCVFGKAMASRILSRPPKSMTTLSIPKAIPPCGGAPYWRASRRNPKRSTAFSGVIPSNSKPFVACLDHEFGWYHHPLHSRMMTKS